ncbi:MAG TPA: hypothetical protein VJC37_09180 [Planctomycetota bacterium]|nr:hypothetical protein [Planctomycetota bacterium]
MPALILLLTILLCGCAASNPAATQTSRILPTRIPFQIKDKAVIGIVPVLSPEPSRKKDFYDYFLPPPNQDKYDQSRRYTAIIANKIRENLEQKGFVPFVATPARTEDLYAPEFFEVLKISCPSDYCIIIYLYELLNSEKKVGRTDSEKESSYPVEQWQHDAVARSRIELYESANMNLIWQHDIMNKALIITEKKISGSKPLDDLAYSLEQPHYYEQINNEVIIKIFQEMIDSFKALPVNINLNHKVKTDIYLYDKKMANDRTLKDTIITVTNIALIKTNTILQASKEPTSAVRQQFITDVNGRVSVELPEGFYQIEAFIPTTTGESKSNTFKSLILGDVRRINIILQ